MTRLVVFGGGRMGTALIGGLVRAGWAAPEDCAVVEPRGEARTALEQRFPGLATSDRAVAGDAVVLAVKPGDAEAVCRGFDRGSYPRVLSIVAGVTIAQLESWLWNGARVLRAMPNTPAVLGLSASAVSAGSQADANDLAWAESVLSAIGVVVPVSEKLLDAVTGLSGSGPAYVFLVAEALIDAGVLQGLDREVARMLTVQTLVGAARMLAETGESAEVLRAAVTSPGGTTAAALRELESHGLRAAFLDAVAAGAARSRALASALPPSR